MFYYIYRFWDWLKNLFWNSEVEITIVGLQAAGKTTYVNLISKHDCKDTIPTIGFNMRKVNHGKTSIKIWDLGGERRFRGMWERYCRGVNAILFMVDVADGDKIYESKRELHDLLKRTQLKHIPLLVLGNKIDLPNAMSQVEMIDHLDLRNIDNREISCFMISCKDQENINVTLQWLISLSQKIK